MPESPSHRRTRQRSVAYRITYRKHSDGWITAERRAVRGSRPKWTMGDDDFGRLLDRVKAKMQPCEHHSTVAFCSVTSDSLSDRGSSTFVETRRWVNALRLFRYDVGQALRRVVRL